MVRITSYMAYSLLGWFACLMGCSSATNTPNGNFGQSPPLKLKHPASAPSSQALMKQFAAAHVRADSVVKLAVPDAQDWAFLTTDYGFTYPNWEAHPGDTLPGPALEYKFYYGLLYQGDTIRSAIVSIGPDGRIFPSELAELVAYQKFLHGGLTIGQQKAVVIGMRHGLKERDVVVTFHTSEWANDTLTSLKPVEAYYHQLALDPALAYWKLQNYCDGCAWLKVGAGTGKLLEQGKTVIIHNTIITP